MVSLIGNGMRDQLWILGCSYIQTNPHHKSCQRVILKIISHVIPIIWLIPMKQLALTPMHMGYSHGRLEVRLWSGTSSRANCARNCVASAASRSPLCNLVTCWNIKSYVLASVWFRFHWFLLPLFWLRFDTCWCCCSALGVPRVKKLFVATTGNDLVAAILVLPTAVVDILQLAVLVEIR